MPKPPQKLEVLELTGWVNQTRSRSNGLISRSTSNDEVPQRSRSNGVLSKESSTSSSLAIQEMKQELMKSGQMAPTLKDFVVKVFNNQEIMKGSDHVARMIYDMYSSGEEGGGKGPAMKAAKAFFVNVWWTAMQYPILTKGKLQYGNERLKDIVDICKNPTENPTQKQLTDFIYFHIGGGRPVCRLYLNVKLDAIPVILGHIAKYIGVNGSHGVGSFKAAGPVAAPGRADSIVVYCKSKEAATKLGTHMLSFASHYNAGVPGMTTRLDPHLGVAIGAEPRHQATGLDLPPKPYAESAQSFGSIRSQLIAMAILNYNANIEDLGTGLDVFSRFVCVAFRGYGLNPMQPGD